MLAGHPDLRPAASSARWSPGPTNSASSSAPARTAPQSWLLRLFRRARLLNTAASTARPRACAGSSIWPGPRFAARAGRAGAAAPAMRLGRGWSGIRLVAALTALLALARGRHGTRASSAGSDLRWRSGLGAITMLRVVVLIALASLVWVAAGGLDRPEAALAQTRPAHRPVPGRLSGQPAVSVAVVADRALRPQSRCLAEPADDPGRPVVHPVQRRRRAPAPFPTTCRTRRPICASAAGNGGARWCCPGVLPYYITGAITASGGCWNAAIVAEAVSWGDTHLEAHGLGAYIAAATVHGDFPRIVLGIAVMSSMSS